MSEDKFLEIDYSDYNLVLSALLNKGTAFTEKERDDFHLHGLIPPQIGTMTQQLNRSYQVFTSKHSPIEKYIYLRDLQDSNETLFYNLLCHHLDEMLPIVYTPTVGIGCQRFSQIYRRPRGLFISYPLRHQMDKILSNERFYSVEVIVASDGERILGLGDQGAGGMGISIGKLTLYTACSGIHPRSTLPILLDVGTDNQELINDPLYLGWKHPRIRGEEYEEFIDMFVKAAQKRWPNILIQWEDFSQKNAFTILHNYQDKACTFNDDIQGTASIVLGTLLAALKASKLALKEHKFVVMGAGSAACGICNLIAEELVSKGLDEEDVYSRFYLIGSQGLLNKDNARNYDIQKNYCKSDADIQGWTVKNKEKITLEEVIDNVEPTALIGVCGQGGIFTESIVKKMTKFSDRPIIFPLSNPTSCSEADPKDIMEWTDGKALIGTGSPYPPIKKNGEDFRVDQTNNAYIFPGLGLGIIAVQAKRVTNGMFIRAAEALAELSPANKDPELNLLPCLTESRKIAKKIAFAVAKEAIKEGLAPEMTDEEIKECIENKVWEPEYLHYRPKKKESVVS